jgi:pimeloyl-ACP methyl ester carboxylesterase
MSDFQLDGSSVPVDLGFGVKLVAPGLIGQGRTHDARQPGFRDSTPGQETAALDEALAAQDMSETMSVELDTTEVPVAGPPSGLRAPGGEDALMLEVPDTGPEWEHVVLEIDEGGAMRWHLPLADDNQVAPPATRGAGAVKRFRIPSAVAPTPTGEQAKTRGLIGMVGKKLLKVLVYPVTDILIGKAIDHFATKWEAKKRPYGLRFMSPDNYATKGAAQLTDADWQHLASGRSLLMIHGTFSTAHGAFSGLRREDIAQLNSMYDGRVFAFDHPSVSVSPASNVKELASRLPAGVRLDVDIVCHSRGGLVAREIAERGPVHGLTTDRLTVGRVVFVGAANSGTLLAQPEHMVNMIDRLTTVSNLIPTGFVSELLDGLIMVVKVIGHGGLKSLDGLASMDPTGPYLKALAGGQKTGATYYAITADFDAGAQDSTAPLKVLVKDKLMDKIFKNTANDLVVPTEGVFAVNDCASFPIESVARLEIPGSAGVVHTTYFLSPDARTKMKEWLTYESPFAIPTASPGAVAQPAGT